MNGGPEAHGLGGLAGLAGLAGRGVLVTRPVDRAAKLCRLISLAGGEPVLFPTLEIVSITKDTHLFKNNDSLDVIKHTAPDLIIFISPTAVAQAHAVLPREWLQHAAVAAVGAATAQALREQGCTGVIVPEGRADSEALAALPPCQPAAVSGRRILIVRGQGGREWLADTLRERGAQVDYFECYRRVRPAVDVTPLLARWNAGGIAAVTMTSGEALDNLVAMLPAAGLALLKSTPMFTVHQRIAEKARALGIMTVRVTGAGDAAMVSGLQRFFATVA